jgi:hypothetical protein
MIPAMLRSPETIVTLLACVVLGSACTSPAPAAESAGDDESSTTGDSGASDLPTDSGSETPDEESTSDTDSGDGDGDGDPGDGDGDPGEALAEVNVYLSGHSLFNLEMPALLAQIAAGQGKTHRYNVQIGNGSTMKMRLSGGGTEQDRNGDVINYSVADEIREANTIDAPHYDALMVTEAVDIFDHLLYSDSIANLGAFYDILVGEVPDARVFFYDSWDSVGVGGGSYASWIAHTRAEFEIWACIVTKVNEARPANPIRPIPGGVLLSDVVEAAEAGEIPGIGPVDLFDPDGHHLSPLGNYVIALGQFAVLYRDTPFGSPTQYAGLNQAVSVASDAAAALEQQVWASVQAFEDATQTLPDVESCRATVSSYCNSAYCQGLVADLF